MENLSKQEIEKKQRETKEIILSHAIKACVRLNGAKYNQLNIIHSTREN